MATWHRLKWWLRLKQRSLHIVNSKVILCARVGSSNLWGETNRWSSNLLKPIVWCGKIFGKASSLGKLCSLSASMSRVRSKWAQTKLHSSFSAISVSKSCFRCPQSGRFAPTSTASAGTATTISSHCSSGCLAYLRWLRIRTLRSATTMRARLTDSLRARASRLSQQMVYRMFLAPSPTGSISRCARLFHLWFKTTSTRLISSGWRSSRI